MLQNAIRTIRTLLPSGVSVTRQEIESAVDSVLAIPLYSEIDKSLLTREVGSLYRIRVDDYRIIELGERRTPWLNDRKTQVGWNFWNRYKDYLEIEKNFPPKTIRNIDRLTDRVLDSLFDPTRRIQIAKKGLVVGQVQSGKTSNYTGLICKAADAGFKVIIVLAGMHKNLRSQTQFRLDEGFLGFDTQHTRAFNQDNIRIGVGRINPDYVAHSLTSSLDNGDFTQGAANALGLNFNTNEPIIAVIKKNPHVLRRVHQWLSAQVPPDVEGRRIICDKSLLLIDDEADHASINISNDPEKRSTINRGITAILNVFGKSGYIGYTATPFANIFIRIEEDTLFPRDFIINLPAPSNYIGPEKVFGFQPLEDEETSENTLPIITRIDDFGGFVPIGRRQQREAPLPSQLPESLKKAIRCFILTCSIRRLRGQLTADNSMLVHVTRYRRWITPIKELIQNQFEYYRRGIDQNDQKVLEEFRQTFEEDEIGYRSYRTVTSQILRSSIANIDPHLQVHGWEDVVTHLNEAAARIEVREIHGGSRDVLDYYEHPNGLSVIAVGGDKLSRGLTLEGLSVSFYLRTSRMYDTLMQMGRWFGYRPGYVDLCRLFTSRELNEWFCHITHASEELRQEFDYMADVAGSTPEQYALKVRTHPGILQISATNKLRSSVTIHLTWSGRLVELYEMQKNSDTIENNLHITREFVANLPGQYEIERDNFLWRNIPPESIINFLSGFKAPENLKAYAPSNLIRFIEKQLPNGELISWSVALMSKRNAERNYQFIINGNEEKIGSYLRRQDDNSSDEHIYYLRKSHVISPRDEFLDLSENEYERAMELTRQHRQRQNKNGEPSYPNGEIVRNEIRAASNPLLLIYTLDPEGTQLSVDSNPLISYAISFPGSRFNEFVAYAVNEQLLDRFNIEEDIEDFDYDED